MPSWTDDELNRILDKSNGYCYYCEIQLAWPNYGHMCKRGGWEVDHGLPLSRGGTDHLNNLRAACTLCNREKSDMNVQGFCRYVDRHWSSWDAFHRVMRRNYC